MVNSTQVFVATLILSVAAAIYAAEPTSLGLTSPDRVSARPDLVITRLGFGSCAKQERAQPIWDSIHAAHCDAFVLCGDNIYGDSSDPVVLREKYDLLDTQSFRSPLKKDIVKPKVTVPNNDVDATVLGDDQWAWLERRLREPAEIRAVVSSISLIATEHGSEKWANFPKERARFLALLRSTQAKGVVVVSGDRHLAEISSLTSTEEVSYPLYELTTSGLNQPASHESAPKQGIPGKPVPNRHRIHEHPYIGSNFGLMCITWDGKNPTLRLEVCGLGGDVVLSHDIPFSELH